MLAWVNQKELVLAAWTYPDVAAELEKTLKSTHFENQALGWVLKIAVDISTTTGSPPTEGQMMERISQLEPHMQAACVSLLPEVRSAELPTPAWAKERGRAFAAYQELIILSGEIPRMAKDRQYERIKNRLDEVMALTSAVVEDQEDGLVVQRIDEAVPGTTLWLWKSFLPRGHVVVCDGDPGLGKSTVLLDIAARTTTGAPMPLFTEEREPADVVILSAEDDVSTTIRPRLEAAGADLTRAHFVSAVKDKDDQRGFEVLRDLDRLEYLISKTKTTLVIIDPLVAYLGTQDFHRDQDVRRILRGLALIANRRGCCIVCVRHMNKDQSAKLIYRGGGSIGVIGAVRTGLLMTNYPQVAQENGERVLAVAKSNLGKIPRSVKLKLVDVPELEVARIEWVGWSNFKAAELLEQ